jgi:hypothetical protein
MMSEYLLEEKPTTPPVEAYDYSLLKMNNKGACLLQLASYELFDKVMKIINELQGTITQEYYISKYNAYVKYDYRPFSIAGFKIELYIDFSSDNYVEYFDYLLDKTFAKVLNLEITLESILEEDNN